MESVVGTPNLSPPSNVWWLLLTGANIYVNSIDIYEFPFNDFELRLIQNSAVCSEAKKDGMFSFKVYKFFQIPNKYHIMFTREKEQILANISM